MKANLKAQRSSGSILRTTAATLALVFVFGSAAEARDRHDSRQTRQRARVHEGVQSGELTAGERHRLQKSKRAIRRTEQRFQNNDGAIGDKEAAVLEQMQDARSQQINRLKHNDKSRGDGPRSEDSSSN